MTRNDNNLPALRSDQQYRLELSQLRRLSEQEKEELTELARKGNKEARTLLIGDRMRLLEPLAYRYATTYLRIEDYLDLVQIANLALVTFMDRALHKDVPVAYLYGCAKRAMWNYCLFHSRIIQIPTHTIYLEMDIPKAVSLEELLEDEDNEMWMAYYPLADLLDELEPEEKPAFDALYGELHSVVQSLPEKQREVVTRHYGLDEFGPETLAEIEQRVKKQGVYNRHRSAIARLRKHFLKQA